MIFVLKCITTSVLISLLYYPLSLEALNFLRQDLKYLKSNLSESLKFPHFETSEDAW